MPCLRMPLTKCAGRIDWKQLAGKIWLVILLGAAAFSSGSVFLLHSDAGDSKTGASLYSQNYGEREALLRLIKEKIARNPNQVTAVPPVGSPIAFEDTISREAPEGIWIDLLLAYDNLKKDLQVEATKLGLKSGSQVWIRVRQEIVESSKVNFTYRILGPFVRFSAETAGLLPKGGKIGDYGRYLGGKAIGGRQIWIGARREFEHFSEKDQQELRSSGYGEGDFFWTMLLPDNVEGSPNDLVGTDIWGPKFEMDALFPRWGFGPHGIGVYRGLVWFEDLIPEMQMDAKDKGYKEGERVAVDLCRATRTAVVVPLEAQVKLPQLPKAPDAASSAHTPSSLPTVIRLASSSAKDVPPSNPSLHARWRASDGLEMVWIPPGEFVMGSSPMENNSNEDEQPTHELRFAQGFWMDATEVTNAAFQKFLQQNPDWQKDKLDQRFHNGDYLKDWNGTDYPAGKGDHPVVWVSWYAAQAYCLWVGKRLPTEAEWEYAARAGTGTAYWWGDNFDETRTNKKSESVPVRDVRRTNPWGLADILGNVMEWTSSLYRIYPYRLDDGREDPNAGGARVCRGWSFFDEALQRVAYRYDIGRGFCDKRLGFRCVREPN